MNSPAEKAAMAEGMLSKRARVGVEVPSVEGTWGKRDIIAWLLRFLGTGRGWE